MELRRLLNPLTIVAIAWLAASDRSDRIARGDDWPTFRGPDRTAVATDTDLL